MHILRSLTSLAAMFVASSAFAASFWVQLDPGTIDSQPLAFKVKTEKTTRGGVLFYFYVESKKEVLSKNVAASLTLASGKKQIAWVDMDQKEYDQGAHFRFEVSPKYLGQSKFQFKDIGGSGEVYWFFLKDFAGGK